jgi:hypothetical protein
MQSLYLTKEKVMDRWEQIARQLLLNKKIVNVRYMSENEMEDMGWNVRSVAFQTEDGLWFFPSRDDEGNDGGALFTSDEKHSCLPVI